MDVAVNELSTVRIDRHRLDDRRQHSVIYFGRPKQDTPLKSPVVKFA